MKYFCDACSRLVPVTAFAVREGVLVVSCPVCNQESRSEPGEDPAPALAVADAVPRVDSVRPPAPVIALVRDAPAAGRPLCPKCASPRTDDRETCARCGLAFALFNPADFALPPPLEALWAGLEASWNAPARHQEFIEACVQAAALPEAARRYRLRAEQAPTDALAIRFRDEVVARLLAVTALVAPRPAREAPARNLAPLWALLFALLLAAVAYLAKDLISRAPLP